MPAVNCRSIVPAFAVIFATVSVAAQKPTDVVRWTASAPAKPVRPGDTARVELKAEIQEGWYLYAMTQPTNGPVPLDVALAKGEAFTMQRDRIDVPLPKIKKDPNFDGETQHYEEKVTLTLPLTAPRGAKPGAHKVPIEVTFQACSGSICLRPTTTVVPVDVKVGR